MLITGKTIPFICRLFNGKKVKLSYQNEASILMPEVWYNTLKTMVIILF